MCAKGFFFSSPRTLSTSRLAQVTDLAGFVLTSQAAGYGGALVSSRSVTSGKSVSPLAGPLLASACDLMFLLGRRRINLAKGILPRSPTHM